MINWIRKWFERRNLEIYFNNKYPKRDLYYKRKEIDREYKIDLRNFIQDTDSKLPMFKDGSDDEKALSALKFVINNIEYTPDKNEYGMDEYWAYAYQTLYHKRGDCEDGAILLNNILIKSGIPYWKLRLSCGFVDFAGNLIGHAYLNYYCEETNKWVVLDWCYWPNILPINERIDYKNEQKYKEVWFSWNKYYCYSEGLNKEAKKLVNDK